jgi:hypothetical protein
MGRLGWILAAVGGAGAVAGLAYLASGGASKPAPGTPGSSTTSTGGYESLQVILKAGQMDAISLSLASNGGNTASFTTPAGAASGINLISSDSTTVQTTGMTTPAVATAKRQGTANLAAAWTDASGVAQTSQIPITVTA